MPHIVYSQATGPPDFEWDDEPAVDDLAPDGAGCRCTEGNCVQQGCPCRSAACRFDSLGRPVVQGESVDALHACGPRCSCAGACSSKAAQWRLAIRRGSGKRGWAVYAAEPLPEGALIGLYSGEFLSTPEAVKRLKEYDLSGGGHALLVLREWLPSRTAAVRINIDATRRGNVARFYNHSCDGGNLRLLLTRQGRGNAVQLGSCLWGLGGGFGTQLAHSLVGCFAQSAMQAHRLPFASCIACDQRTSAGGGGVVLVVWRTKPRP